MWRTEAEEEQQQACEACKRIFFPSQSQNTSDPDLVTFALPLLKSPSDSVRNETQADVKTQVKDTREKEHHPHPLITDNNNNKDGKKENQTSDHRRYASPIPPSLIPLSSSSSSSSREILDIHRAAAGSLPSFTSWRQLPPCPISGYYLTEEGVWEESEENASRARGGPSSPIAQRRTNHHPASTAQEKTPSPHISSAISPPAILISAEGLRRKIHQLQRLEQEAKMEVDNQLPDQVRTRSLRGLEVIVNSLLFCTGIYYMTWKSAGLYRGATPRQSLFFTKALALFRRFHVSAHKREELAQRHRRLLQATNARVAFSFCTGLGLATFAWWTRPASTVLDDAPEMKRGKEVVLYQKISSAALKWMWYVYYHHPAYAMASARTTEKIS